MERADQFSILSITISNSKHAQKLAGLLLEKKLCACVHIVPKITSMYWWKGKINRDSEAWMIVKTHRKKIKQLEKYVLQHHPYDVPEILEIQLKSGTSDYLDWLRKAVENK